MHVAIGNLKAFLLGTYHAVSPKHRPGISQQVLLPLQAVAPGKLSFLCAYATLARPILRIGMYRSLLGLHAYAFQQRADQFKQLRANISRNIRITYFGLRHANHHEQPLISDANYLDIRNINMAYEMCKTAHLRNIHTEYNLICQRNPVGQAHLHYDKSRDLTIWNVSLQKPFTLMHLSLEVALQALRPHFI